MSSSKSSVKASGLESTAMELRDLSGPTPPLPSTTTLSSLTEARVRSATPTPSASTYSIAGAPVPAGESDNGADAAAAAKEANFRAVMICISSFSLVFTTCGVLFSFGVYQELYQSLAVQPGTPFTGATPAVIDLIGTLSAAFMTIGAPVATAWTKRYSPRVVVLVGAVFFFLSCILASFSTHLWQFMLTQGVLQGLGTCFSYMPAVTVAPVWYGARRGLAMGIIMSGTGVGGLVWAPVMQALNAHVGFRNALRISGGVAAVLLAAASFWIDWDPASKARHEVENRAARQRNSAEYGTSPVARLRFHLVQMWNIPLVDWRIARSSKFAAQMLGGFLQSAAYYTPTFFFSAYARTLGYSAAQGANFIAVGNAANAIGKIALGIAADRYGRVNMLLLTTVVSAVASFGLWLPSTAVGASSLAASRGLFITYAVAYGTFASAYVSLFPTSLVELFGPQNFASVNGILYMARGLATLFGTPTAGALLRSSGESKAHVTSAAGYLHMTIMVGALLAGASVAVMWARWEQRKRPY